MNAFAGRVAFRYRDLNLLSFYSLFFLLIQSEREKQEEKKSILTTIHGCVHCTYCCFNTCWLFFPVFFLWLEKGEWSQILERYIVFIFIRSFALNRAIAIKMWQCNVSLHTLFWGLTLFNFSLSKLYWEDHIHVQYCQREEQLLLTNILLRALSFHRNRENLTQTGLCVCLCVYSGHKR